MSGVIYHLDINSLDSSEPLSSLDALICERSESQEGNEIRLSGDTTLFSEKTYDNLIQLISIFQQNSIKYITVDHKIQYHSKSQSHKKWLAECTKAGIKFQQISIERSHRSSKRPQELQDPKAEESTVKPAREHHSTARAEPVSRKKSMSQRRHISRVNLNIANLETPESTQSIINDFRKFTLRSYVLFIFSENKIKQIDSNVYNNLYLLIKDAKIPSPIIISPHIDFQSNRAPYDLLLSGLIALNIELVNHSSYNAIQSEKTLVETSLIPVEHFINKKLHLPCRLLKKEAEFLSFNQEQQEYALEFRPRKLDALLKLATRSGSDKAARKTQVPTLNVKKSTPSISSAHAAGLFPAQPDTTHTATVTQKLLDDLLGGPLSPETFEEFLNGGFLGDEVSNDEVSNDEVSNGEVIFPGTRA